MGIQTQTLKTIIIGLGNPLLGDDGVGWRVAEQIQAQLTDPAVEVDCLAGGGLSVMERLIGYDRALVIDALDMGSGAVGTVTSCPLTMLPNPAAGHLGSAHETNLQTALEVGRRLGAHLPAEITVVAIEVPPVYDFSETLTPPVAAAVPRAVRSVLDWLGR